MDQNLAKQIEAMQWYKEFEPYIVPETTLEDRMEGNITLSDDAPEEAQNALSKWKVRKLSERLF